MICKSKNNINKKEVLAKFAKSHVLVVGLEGVGAYKVLLIATCLEKEVPIVSSMGAGGKIDPDKVCIADIEKSYNCKLAKMVRKRLHKRRIYQGCKVVFSPEDVMGTVIKPDEDDDKEFDPENFTKTGSTVGTISYMPAVFGCHCASVVLRDLAGM